MLTSSPVAYCSSLGGAAEIAERIKGGCDAFTLVLASF